jgi:hypothetical protein
MKPTRIGMRGIYPISDHIQRLPILVSLTHPRHEARH